MLRNIGILASTANVQSLLPKVSVPTLLISPTRSLLAPLEEQVMMRKTIPNARIVTVEGPGHELYWDVPEPCISALLSFISQVEV